MEEVAEYRVAGAGRNNISIESQTTFIKNRLPERCSTCSELPATSSQIQTSNY